MEALGLDNIFGEAEIDNLFMDDTEETSTEETVEVAKEEETPDGKEKHDDTTTTEVDPEDLFEEEEKKEKPESVGSGKETKGKEGSSTDTGGGTSPENFYSSIANAMAEDGIFPNLDEEAISKVTDAESLHEAIEAEVQARFDDGQKRVLKALENGVRPDDIRNYETTLNNLASIKDEHLREESEKGEQLRYNLIFQDYLNQGMKPEKAEKFAKQSIDAGTDIEDAKEALQSNKEFFQKKYNSLLEDAQKKADEDKAERQKQADKLKDSIMKDKALMGDMEINQDVRKKIFENVFKPVYKDPETGEYLTAIQKYETEHRSDFLKYVSLFFTMTNGFKDFDSLTKGKVKKEVRKGLSELEKTLNGTKRNSDGSLKMVTSVTDDPESFITKGFKLDI
jgi:hypothetical protein